MQWINHWKRNSFDLTKKQTVFVENLEVKLIFVLQNCLRNIWMVPKRHLRYPKRFDMLIVKPIITKIIHWNLKPNKAVKKNITHINGATKRPIQNKRASPFPPKLDAKGPFIYYVSTFLISHHIFTNFLSNLFLFYVLKISKYSLKISSKCNVEKEILLFRQKNSFCEKLGSQIKFCGIKVLT